VLAIFPSAVPAILPEILLLVLGILVLVADPFWKKDESRRAGLGWLTTCGLLAILVVTIFLARPGSESQPFFGGMLRHDWLAFVFKIFFLFAALVTALFFVDTPPLNRRAESYFLLLAATLGMCLMASAADLVMLYLAIETTSIPLYILAGFLVRDEKSTESGLKYMLFGAMTSAVLLYGLSLAFGFSGRTGLAELSASFVSFTPFAIGTIFLILVGLAFKVSLFPFHFWAPDVYEGSPTAVAGFLSTASKAAGFVALIRLFTTAFPALSKNWTWILAVLAALTMTVGNLIALAQLKDEGNIKRLLAYSSIAHAGYAMIGVVAFSEMGIASTVFYLFAYLLTNLAAFGIIIAISRVGGSDSIASFKGLSRRNPALALMMLVAFLSLSGMPPLGGFVAKVFVFIAAVEKGWIWLAVVGVLNSIIGLYTYLTVLKYAYLYRLEGEDEERHPVPLSRPRALALAVLTIGIIMIGVIIAPWFRMAMNAAAALF